MSKESSNAAEFIARNKRKNVFSKGVVPVDTEGTKNAFTDDETIDLVRGMNFIGSKKVDANFESSRVSTSSQFGQMLN